MNLAGKNILNSMNTLISPCCPSPSNLFQIPVVGFMNASYLKQGFFNFFFDSSRITVFLRSTEIWAIIASNYCYSIFWGIFFLRVTGIYFIAFGLVIVIWILLGCFCSFWIWFLFVFKCLDILICFSFHFSATIFQTFKIL